METNSFFTKEVTALGEPTLPTATYIDLGPLPSSKLFFIDLNNGHPEDARGDILTEERALRAQCINILSTPLGSEPFEPEYGSLLPYRLFEPINQRTAWMIENDTIIALTRWMRGRLHIPREQCFVRPIENEDGYYIQLNAQVLRSRAVVEWNISVYR